MKLLKYIYTIAAVLVLLPACQKENTQQYLRISNLSYTFDNSGEDSIIVEVLSSATWTTESSEDWLKVTAVDEKTAVIKADKNETNDTRTAKVTFMADGMTAEFNAEQFNNKFEGMFQDFYNMPLMHLSPSGVYAAGMDIIMTLDGAMQATPIIINTQTKEITKLETQDYFNEVHTISDNGKVLILCNGYQNDYRILVDGEEFNPTLPEGYVNIRPQAVNTDGTIIIGYATNKATGKYMPIKWTNGEPEVLEIPEINGYGQPLANGAMARGCSADGSIIYGSEWDAFSAIYWKDGKMIHYPSTFMGDNIHFVEKGEFDFTFNNYIHKSADFKSASPDGKYIAASFKVGDMEYLPAVINTETEEVTVFDNIPSGNGQCVDNNGRFYASGPSVSMGYGYVVDLSTNEYKSLPDYLSETYGIYVANNRIAWDTNAEGTILCGGSAIPTDLGGNTYTSWLLVL